MILEYKVNELNVQPSWLKTFYSLVEELDCKCKTYVEEAYNPTQKQLARTRIIEVSGADSMLVGLKFRIERLLKTLSVAESKAIISELH